MDLAGSHRNSDSLVFSFPVTGFRQVITPLIGLQNVYNLLAATAVGISVNIPIEVTCPSAQQSSGKI